MNEIDFLIEQIRVYDDNLDARCILKSLTSLHNYIIFLNKMNRARNNTDFKDINSYDNHVINNAYCFLAKRKLLDE